MLIVDTGPLVAAADRTDRHHTASAELLETATGPLVTTAMVVAEAVYLLTRELGGHAEPAFYDAIVNFNNKRDTLLRPERTRLEREQQRRRNA